MSIKDIHYGDITTPRNKHDIIIGMNTRLAQASAIGHRVLVNNFVTRELEPGDVVTFKFDEHRNLHMIICHRLCTGGWLNAEKYVRIGLDYLWQRHVFNTHFSIVRIGTGMVGIRDGADASAIHTAMTVSWAPLHLYIWNNERHEVGVEKFPPLKVLRTWSTDKGEREIRMAV